MRAETVRLVERERVGRLQAKGLRVTVAVAVVVVVATAAAAVARKRKRKEAQGLKISLKKRLSSCGRAQILQLDRYNKFANYNNIASALKAPASSERLAEFGRFE